MKSYMPRMVVVERIDSVKEELKKMENDHHSLMESLQLTQKNSERARSQLKEKNVLTERL